MTTTGADHPDHAWITRAAPPQYVIDSAINAARCSPCAKSRRGVVIFNPEEADRFVNASGVESFSYADRNNSVVVSNGYNGQPDGFICTRTKTCAKHCADLCMHAEQRAILAAGASRNLEPLELVHVKVDLEHGVLVAGKRPCCIQCSRMVADVRLAGVWLYVSTDVAGESHADDPPCTCGARKATWPGDPGTFVLHAATCPSMPYFAAWAFYTAYEFHRATLRNNGVTFHEERINNILPNDQDHDPARL